jgi:nucleotide-binding universal stress UspA family protein
VSWVRRVIVGTSGSPGSLPALRCAGNLAEQNDAQLVAVHAWVPPGGELADLRYPNPHMRKLWADAAAQRLTEAADAAWAGAPAGPRVRVLVVRGEPGPVLVDIADAGGDLLVVGAGRRGRLARLWRGRVSRYCLARARCPVLAVPPAALAGRTGPRAWSFRHRELTVEQAVAAWASAEPGRDRS